jgi:Kef-type K+ transport system membrane component KefB
MLDVGLPSLWVALLGVVVPFALGFGVGALVLPDRSVYVHAFLGATLTATSVGITARVLSDLNKSKTAEARVILGAAVIDDVLGLVILAVVAGIISAADQGTALSAGDIAAVIGKAAAFLFGALLLLVFCFALAYLSSLVGLAPIVGAYAAGLILEDVHFKGFEPAGERDLEHLLRPIVNFLVPVFFVLMGMMVDLRTFARVEVLGLAGLLTVAAIAGKQACSLAPFGRPLDRLSIGIGMVPRGEVGLIFANIGLGLSIAGEPVIDQGLFSAVVIMVIVTTMVTPPALKWSLSRGAPANTVSAHASSQPADG